jgi:hypothetical protein
MDPTNLPIAVDYEEPPDRIRQDLLGCLYWNVFGPHGEVSVRDGATLTPLSNHAIKSESIADPPLSRLAVHINVCETKHGMDETDEEEYRYQAPEPLVIEKLDGSPISLSDFVTQVHPYLNANQDAIYKCEGENYYRQPGELEGGTMFVGNEPDDFVSFDGRVTSSDFLRSSN